jgi:transcriptional regulator with XRE-family HTH domain
VSDLRVGRIIRAVRIEQRLRQSDVGSMANCHQSVVSDLEAGRLEAVSLSTARRVCTGLGIDLIVEARWRGGAADRLIDRKHAAIVNYVAKVLSTAGWIVEAELSFNEYGERGSVDLVAWQPERRVLLLVEVKATLTDLQAMLFSTAKKVRLVPGIVARERGWHRLHLGRLLVVASTSANRAIIARHRAMFDAAFPSTSMEARAWIRAPDSEFAGIWFVSSMAVGHARTSVVSRVRPTHASDTAR